MISRWSLAMLREVALDCPPLPNSVVYIRYKKFNLNAVLFLGIRASEKKKNGGYHNFKTDFCFGKTEKWIGWITTLITGSVESSRTWITRRSAGHESPHAAPMESL